MRQKLDKVALTLGLLALVAGGSNAQECLTDYHVLAVGINKYQSPRMTNLGACVKDAEDLAFKFNLERGNKDQKSHKLLDEKATRQAIGEELNTLPDWVAEGGAVVISLSGHGDRNNDRWYFCPHDFDPSRPEATALFGEDILKALDALIVRKRCRVILIIDACLAGHLYHTANEYLHKYSDPKGGGLIVFLACASNQFSKELNLNGAFTSAIMDGLWNTVANYQRDKIISLKELKRYVLAAMKGKVRQGKLLPGIAWPDQDCIIDCSLSISEGIGLVPVLDVNPPQPLPGYFPTTKQPAYLPVAESKDPIVGLWQMRRTIVRTYKPGSHDPAEYVTGRDGKPIEEVFELALRENGTFLLAFQDRSGSITTSGGRYHFLPGREFTLTYVNGKDYVGIERLTATELSIKWVLPSRGELDQFEQIGKFPIYTKQQVFTFTRVK